MNVGRFVSNVHDFFIACTLNTLVRSVATASWKAKVTRHLIWIVVHSSWNTQGQNWVEGGGWTANIGGSFIFQRAV
jgi:hypothetical protein